MGKVEPEFVLVFLDRFERGQFYIGVASKTAWVDAPSVILCLAVHNLLSQQPAVTAAFAQSGAQTDDSITVALAWNGADPTRSVDGICDRTIDDVLDTDFGQDRHTFKNAL